MSRALFGMSFVDSLPHWCLAHCFVCVLVTVCDVSALRVVLYVFCLIVWHVSALRTVLNVCCKICSPLIFLHTVLNVFFMIV